MVWTNCKKALGFFLTSAALVLGQAVIGTRGWAQRHCRGR